MGNNDWHEISLDDFYSKVNSDGKGLTTSEAQKRLTEHGLNQLYHKEKISPLMRFLKQFTNFFALLLIFGSLLAFFAEYLSPGDGNKYIGMALGGVVVLNAIFTFIQEYQSEKIMESFKKMMPSEIIVIRDGENKKVPAVELVPGDLVYLQEGDKIPADARLIEVNNLKVDNSSLTGESEPQLRSTKVTHDSLLESRNMVFSGTLVQSGNGKAIVYGTGMSTEIGRIAKLTKDTEEVITPLKREINHFISIISSIAIFLGVTFFIISYFSDNQLMGSMIFAIGIIVANVPEGLLPTVTLALTLASKKMAKQKALIKNLESVETLGSTTVICTDKTGTITQNKMSVNTLILNNEEMNISEKGISKNYGFEELCTISVLCNNSSLKEDGKNYLGDPTEGSLLVYANENFNLKSIFSKNPRKNEFPFDSKTKRMITINKTANFYTANMKGAPEVVINKCGWILLNGREVKLTPVHRKKIDKFYQKLASRGERVLGFAYKHLKQSETNEKGFVFVGLIGIVDPPRPEIPGAVKKCREAGIKIIMITGDYSMTAEAIARKVGIIDKDDPLIIEGKELRKLSDKQLDHVLRKDSILFARTSPEQKLRIVKALQAQGEVVSVTGDGVNDAPALKNADMGVAMGVVGTEVAREASKMVLMDDNFATIVKAVEEGRTIFDNIKKFIAYILTSNIPEILPFIAFVLLDIPLPLTVILILSIDLGTDLLPALGLGIEKPEYDVMKKPPRKRSERLLTPKLLFMSYGIIGMLQAAAGFFSFFVILYMGGWTYGQELAITDPLYLKAISGFFASIIICQIADVMICRARRQSVFTKGLFSNWLVNLGILTELILLAIIVYLPFTQPFFGTHSLTLFELSLSIPFMLVIFFGDELRKILVRRGNKFVMKYLYW